LLVPAELLSKKEQTPAEPEAASSLPEDPLHEWARKHVERVRRLKMNVAAYVTGMVALTGVWVLVEWSDNGAFKRFDLSDDGTPGDWEPWILYVALIWGLFVVIDALKVHFDRPTTEDEIDREVRRLESHD
jgi:hypothetical protein